MESGNLIAGLFLSGTAHAAVLGALLVGGSSEAVLPVQQGVVAINVSYHEAPPASPIHSGPDGAGPSRGIRDAILEGPAPSGPYMPERMRRHVTMPSIGGAQTSATALGTLAPHYPNTSRRRGEEGRVVYRAAINCDGSVTAVDLVASSGFARLDQAAREALEAARFLPAQSNGVPVATQQEVAFVFRLDGYDG